MIKKRHSSLSQGYCCYDCGENINLLNTDNCNCETNSQQTLNNFENLKIKLKDK